MPCVAPDEAGAKLKAGLGAALSCVEAEGVGAKLKAGLGAAAASEGSEGAGAKLNAGLGADASGLEAEAAGAKLNAGLGAAAPSEAAEGAGAKLNAGLGAASLSLPAEGAGAKLNAGLGAVAASLGAEGAGAKLNAGLGAAVPGEASEGAGAKLKAGLLAPALAPVLVGGLPKKSLGARVTGEGVPALSFDGEVKAGKDGPGVGESEGEAPGGNWTAVDLCPFLALDSRREPDPCESELEAPPGLNAPVSGNDEKLSLDVSSCAGVNTSLLGVRASGPALVAGGGVPNLSEERFAPKAGLSLAGVAA